MELRKCHLPTTQRASRSAKGRRSNRSGTMWPSSAGLATILGRGRALRDRELRYRSQPTEPDGQMSHQAKQEPFVHGFPRARGGLKPGITYYYTVDSMGGDGTRDGVESTVYQFTTPADLQEP